MSCPHCPCPGSCLAWDTFCQRASTGDPLWIAHIKARSAIASGATPAPSPDPPTVAQSRAALARVKACPWLVKRSDCGCGVNWCAQYQHTTTRQECTECIEDGANA